MARGSALCAAAVGCPASGGSRTGRNVTEGVARVRGKACLFKVLYRPNGRPDLVDADGRRQWGVPEGRVVKEQELRGRQSDQGRSV